MMEYFKSLKWIDYFFFCLIEPRRLVNLIERKEGSPVFMGMIIVIISSFFQIIAFSMFGAETAYFYVKITYGWIFYFLAVLIQILLFASLWDMVSQFRSHKGSIKLLINLVCFSFLPLVFILPVLTIFMTIKFAPVFFYILFLLLLVVWQAMIIVQGISEIYQIGFGESLFIFVIPFIVFGITSFFLVILFFINIFGYFSNL